MIEAETADTSWTCPRCREKMQDQDCAEGCEDFVCPALGAEG